MSQAFSLRAAGLYVTREHHAALRAAAEIADDGSTVESVAQTVLQAWLDSRPDVQEWLALHDRHKELARKEWAAKRTNA